MIWWSLKLWESRNWTAGMETGKSVNLRDAFSSLLPPCQLILKAIKRKLCIVVIITHMWNIENLVMHMMFQTVSLHYIYISHIILHIYTYIYMCVCVPQSYFTQLYGHTSLCIILDLVKSSQVPQQHSHRGVTFFWGVGYSKSPWNFRKNPMKTSIST